MQCLKAAIASARNTALKLQDDLPRRLGDRSMKKISSDFALLDVKRGRAALAKRIKSGERVPVTIRGYIDTVHSHDDGTSIEFALTDVEAVERTR